MNCPVCNARDLNDDAAQCPQCHSDLEIFRLIVDANEQRQKNKKIISALSLFAAVTAIGWASAGIFLGKASAPTLAEPVELCPDVPMTGECRAVPSDSEMIVLLQNENDVLKSEMVSYGSETKHTAKKSAATHKGKNTGKKKAAKKN